MKIDYNMSENILDNQMEKLQKYLEQMQSNLDEIKKLLEPQQEKKVMQI